MKTLSASRRLLLFVIGITIVPIFVGCTYTPKPATLSEISSNTDRGKILNNVKAAIRSMGLIVKEQDPEGGYISAVKEAEKVPGVFFDRWCENGGGPVEFGSRHYSLASAGGA
ncbi:MAG: hypothetical protein ABIP05_01915 [Nitrospiraceae bacterium]